jgi:cation:H+ antiporter
MLAKGRLERYDGLILLVLTAMFLYDQIHAAQSHRREARVAAGYEEEIGRTPHRPSVIAAMLFGGLIALPVGAELTIRGAAAIAASWGISEEVIGLTIIAIGTSLPELATSVLAVIRKNHAVALGNVIGSNIFNIGLIMGATAGFTPIAVAGRIVWADMWAMLAASVLIALFAHYKIAISRPIGITMLVAYVLYVGLSYVV